MNKQQREQNAINFRQAMANKDLTAVLALTIPTSSAPTPTGETSGEWVQYADEAGLVFWARLSEGSPAGHDVVEGYDLGDFVDGDDLSYDSIADQALSDNM